MRKRVLKSVETAGGERCVDLFIRPDGSHGFEEYRRDPEDPSGWRATGGQGARIFATAGDAETAARAWAPSFWLD